MDEDRALANPRWEEFCLLFVFGNPKYNAELRPKDQEAPDTRNNATQSYILAGYQARGRNAWTAASRICRDVRVQNRIVELRKMEQRAATVYLRHWKTILPKAQRKLEEILDMEGVSAQTIQAAKEVIEQSEGPSRFRFGVQKGADTDGTLNITLWSGSNRGDDS